MGRPELDFGLGIECGRRFAHPKTVGGCSECIVHCVEHLVFFGSIKDFWGWDGAGPSAGDAVEKDIGASPPYFDGIAYFVLIKADGRDCVSVVIN